MLVAAVGLYVLVVMWCWAWAVCAAMLSLAAGCRCSTASVPVYRNVFCSLSRALKPCRVFRFEACNSNSDDIAYNTKEGVDQRSEHCSTVPFEATTKAQCVYPGDIQAFPSQTSFQN